LRILVSFLAIITLVGCKPAPSQGDLETKVLAQQHTFAVVANSIEQYHSAKGSYPLRLDEVENLAIPTVSLPERFSSLRTAPISYEVSRDRSFFRLTYGIHDSDDYNLHASLSYLSLNKKWALSRYLEGLTHVEAAYYGSEYQKTLSSKYLTLAVLSLLESAKSNSTYPCRNFWKDWVVKAIGSGQPMNHPLPKRPGTIESVVYVTKNGPPIYAFAFQSKLYPTMTKPLILVEAVYQKQAVGNEWTLVQQCDASF
jgi:hypothetical protein